MEHTKKRHALKTVLAAIFAVAFTLAMVFAILPATTLTAHAEGETIEIDTNKSKLTYTSGCVTITVNEPGDGDGAQVDENRLMVISVSGNVVIKNAKVRIGYYYQEAGDVRSDVCDEVNVEGSGNHNTYVTFSNVNAKKITISTPFDMVQIDHVSVELIPVNGVTYELNGGSFDGEYIDYYFDDQGLTLPTNAVKSHYNFLGWYDNAELTGNAVTAIGADETGSKTFWAKWELTKHNITYNTNEGEWNGEYSTTYQETIGLTLPTNVTKPHFTFAGWYSNAEFDGEAVTEITDEDSGDKEYWAKWEHITHNIIYHLNGGEWEDGISAPTFFNEGERFYLVGPDCIMPVSTGYMFYGWFTSDTLDQESEIQIIQANVTNDVELWAAWGLAPVAPTIEDICPTAGETEHKGDAVTVTATANENGFVLDKTHSIKITFEEGLFPDHVIYLIVADGYEYNAQPQYIDSDNQYNEVFITSSWGNVGHGGYSYDGINILSGPTIGAPWPFDFEAFDGSITVTLSKEYSEKSLVFKQIHVIAHHVRTVTYNENDGIMPEKVETSYLESRGLELPIPTRNAYAFIGWYDNEALEGDPVTEITVADTGDKEFFAKWEFIEVVDLSKVTDNVTIYDGQTITGELKDNYKVTIADGAKVTLKDVTINGENSIDYNWAGITCLGDATIILEGENTVKGFHEDYSGICVPDGKTLTIEGEGTLSASSNGYAAGIGANGNSGCGNIVIKGGVINATGGSGAAGIGGSVCSPCGDITINGGTVTATGDVGIGAGNKDSCGDITISGGTVTATGGNNGTGIGSGFQGSCGAITISGGTVTATGGDDGAGIGSGCDGECGDITITDKVKKVTAVGGSGAPNSIGIGNGGSCGTVTIGGEVFENGISDSMFVYMTATAEDVIALIGDLGTAEYTEEYKEKLDEAREMYDALSDEDKKKIDAATLKKLTDAEKSYQELKDEKIAGETTDVIDNLPSLDDITIDDKGTIEAARAAYDALTDDQKKKVDPETLETLEAAEKEINDIEKATEVIGVIDALSEITEVTTANKGTIEAARAAYDALTDDQKKKVDPETLNKLTDAEKALAAATITEELDKLPDSVDDITMADKNAVEAARKAYEALDEDMKDTIPQNVIDRLLAAEDKIDTLFAADVSDVIDALKDDPNEITYEDQADVSAARAAYDALTDKQKAKVAPETLKKLTDAEEALKTFNERAAAPVIELMKALPETVTSENKEQVLAARADYDKLTREQKALVPQGVRDKLLAAEKALADISLIGYRWYVGYSYDIKGAYFRSQYGLSFLSNDVLASISNYSNTWYFNFESAPGDQGGYSISYWTFNVTDGSTPKGLEVVSGSGTEEDPYVFGYVTEPAPEYVSVDAMSVVKGYNVDFAVDRVVPVKAVFNPAYATDKSVRWSVQGDALVLYEDKDCTIPVNENTTSATVYAKGVKLGSVVITAESLDIHGVVGKLETEVVVDQNIGMTWFLHYEHEITADRFAYEGGSGQRDLNGYELILIEQYRGMDGYYRFVFEKDGRHENFTIYMDGETRVPTGLRITGGAGVNGDPYYIEPIYEEPPYAAVEGISLSETELEAYTGEIFVITATFDPKYSTDRRVIWSSGEGVELYADKTFTTLVGSDATDVLSVFLKGVKLGQTTVTVTSVENSAATASMNVNVLDGSKKVFVDYNLYSYYSAWHGDKLIVREVGSTEPFATLELTETGGSSGRLYLDSGKYYELVWFGGEDAEYCGFQFINSSTADRLCYVADCGEFEDDQVVATFYVTNRVIVRIDLDIESLNIAEGETGSIVPEVNPGKVEDTTMTWSLNKSGYIELFADRDCTTPLPDVIDSRSSVYVKGIKSGIATITFTSVQNPHKHAYCAVTVAAAQPTVTVSYELGGDWSGATLYVRTHGSDNDVTQLTDWYSSGNFTLPVGAYDLVWEKGNRQGTYKFTLTFDGTTIDSDDLTLEDGVVKTFAVGSDSELASLVDNLINGINAVEDLAIDDNAELEAVRAAYDALTDEQKQLIGQETLDKLVAAEEEMADIVAAFNVEDAVWDLPEIADLTIDDKEDIEAARAAYDALTDDQKKKVDPETLKKLEAAEKEINDIEKATEVTEAIVALPEITEVTTADKEDIEAARAAYDALTDDQKKKVDPETLKKLEAAEKAISDIEKATEVTEAIVVLPEITEVTIADKGTIEAARAAYDALTDDQKKKVAPESLKKLEAAESGYKVAEVETLIEKIGDVEYTPESQGAIAAARAAYDALTPEQKALVDNYGVLTTAEAAYGQKGIETDSGVSGGIIAGLIVVSLAILAALCMLVILLKQFIKNKKQVKVRSTVLGLPLLAVAASSSAATVLYVLIGIFALIAIADAVLFAMNKKSKEAARKETEKVEKEQTEQVAQEEVALAKNDSVTATEAVEDDSEDGGVVVDAKGNYFNIRYNKSFTAKLIQSSDETKGYYGELKNEVLSYAKAKSRVSWAYDSLNAGRAPVVKFGIRGKTLCVYFPLDAQSLDEKYKVETIGSAKYAAVPCMYRIKNERRLQYAKDLIAEVCASLDLTKGDEQNENYYLPDETTEALIAKGLIKELKTQATVTQIERARKDGAIRIVESVSVNEVNDLISNEVAAAAIVKGETHATGKKEIINVDVLSANFNDGDTVTIDSLKAKKLVPQSAKQVKLLARGTLDKALHVELQDYSIEAVKMIIATGGTVKKA